jgi:CRP-like cAMP-binding protein
MVIAVEGALDVSVREDGGQRKIGRLEPGTCFGEMAVLAGIERNATVAVPSGTTATALEVTRPALRLLRKLPKFGQALDETYRAHGFGRVLEDLRLISDKQLSEAVVAKLRQSARFMVYGKHHVLCSEGEPIDRIILVKSGWIRRSKGVPFHATSPEVVMGMGQHIGVDFVGEGNCLGIDGVRQPANWQFNASLMARTEVLEVPIATLDPQIREELISSLSGLQHAAAPSPPAPSSRRSTRACRS